jgi:DNA-binding transcriptional LysR family regulator
VFEDRQHLALRESVLSNRGVDLRLLRYFVAVVEQGGLRRAAHELHIAPSALSRAVRQLELQVEVQLIERSTSGIRPTAAGRDLLEHARSILAASDAATEVMRAHAQRSSVLRVGMVGGPVVACELTLPILRGFRVERPETPIQALTTSFHRGLDPLLEGEVDVALVRGPADHQHADVIPIACEPRVLLVGAESDLAGESSVQAEDILKEPTITLDGPADWVSFWELDNLRGGSYRRPGLAPARTVRQMQDAVARGAVVSTSGAVHRLMPANGTAAVDLQGIDSSTILVARRRGDRRRVVEHFIDHAGATAQAHISLIPGGSVA